MLRINGRTGNADNEKFRYIFTFTLTHCETHAVIYALYIYAPLKFFSTQCLIFSLFHDYLKIVGKMLLVSILFIFFKSKKMRKYKPIFIHVYFIAFPKKGKLTQVSYFEIQKSVYENTCINIKKKTHTQNTHRHKKLNLIIKINDKNG